MQPIDKYINPVLRRTIMRKSMSQTEKEVQDNQDYINMQRDKQRGHIYISELPYPSRFVKSRSDHDFLDVRLGAIYI